MNEHRHPNQENNEIQHEESMHQGKEIKHSHHTSHAEHNDHGHHKMAESKDPHDHHNMPATEDSPHHQGMSMEKGGRNHNHDHHKMMVSDFKKRFVVAVILTIPVLLLSPMIQSFFGLNLRFRGDMILLFGLSTIIFLYGGWPFIKGAKKEILAKEPAMMTLITLAICVAYFYSTATVFILDGSNFFWELATLIVVMLLGHWIEMRSVIRSSNALDEIISLMPHTAHVIQKDGTIVDRLMEELTVHDRILVKPGEKIPIDGIIYEGKSDVNESVITGETTPVAKKAGDEVIGGSMNGDGLLKFKVSKTGAETFISQIIKLVEEAQKSKSKTQRLADKAAKFLFYLAVFSGTITFIVWSLLTSDIGFALERAVTVMVISCPHALGLAIPLVTAVSTGIAAKRGLFLKNRAAFEDARKVDTVLFDKTGTLTEGRFGITDIKAYHITEAELLETAYSIEYHSEHPIAKGIVAAGEKRNLSLKPVTNYENITGQGLKANIEGRDYFIMSPSYLFSQDIAFDKETLDRLTKEGKTVVFILSEENVLGYIALTDIIRESAKIAVKELNTLDIDTYMLTGDQEQTASYVAKELQINHVFAEVLPQDKSQKVQELQEKGKIVAMTGDGVNDAPALAKANLGIAIGTGTDVAIETADVILVKSNPKDVLHLIELSRGTYRKMVQNLVWATAYNIIALPLAAGVLYQQGIVISPALGAALMSLSTIIVAINARFIKIKSKTTE